MPLEETVLKLDDADFEFFGDILGRGKSPLAVAGYPGSQEFSLLACHDSGIWGVPENIPWQAEQICGSKNGKDADPNGLHPCLPAVSCLL